MWKASEVANPEHKILRLKPTARNPRAYKIESQGSKPNLNPRPKALRLNPEFKIRAGHDSQVAVALARFARDMSVVGRGQLPLLESLLWPPQQSEPGIMRDPAD